MANQQSNPKSPAAEDNLTDQEKNELQQEMLDKLPDKTTKAQEWGHGYATGKDIATSGDPDAKSEETPNQ